jgi:hypothetical protein
MAGRDFFRWIGLLLVAAPHSLFCQTRPALVPRETPCQVQYARAVEVIGLARWSAPEAERPSIERLLNAAAKAKELVDSSFLQWEAPLCSTETLGRLHASVETIQSNRWLPSTPEAQRAAQAAAANAELLKAIGAGLSVDRPVSSSNSPNPDPHPALTRAPSLNE